MESTSVALPGQRAPLAAAAGVGAAVAADLAFDPVHTHVPLCPFRAATGWWCPLCGGLRSAYSLAHGHLGAAWHDNALLVVALPFLLVAWLDWVVRAGRHEPRRRVPRELIVGVTVLAVVFTIVRNTAFGRAISPL